MNTHLRDVLEYDTCICSDTGCPCESHEAWRGTFVSGPCDEPCAMVLVRIDGEPYGLWEPMPFCETCGNDALDSGLYDFWTEETEGELARLRGEHTGLSHEEQKATLEARISSVLAEYNPALPTYRPR